MLDERTKEYADKLSMLIQAETISVENQTDKSKFYRFQDLLKGLFPHIFSVCEFEDFDGSFLMRWKGAGEGEPIMLMNHQDVVEASGAWRFPPFSGTITEGKVWGRGALDTKGGLCTMLQAADELAKDGYIPKRDVYFLSTCMEECDGSGAATISQALFDRGVRFEFVLDEGGMIVDEPIPGVKGSYAMIGVGEKGCADLKFIARSEGGHASMPGKDTPLVRLGKFMAAVEKQNLFKTELSPTIREMFKRLSKKMKRGFLRFVFCHNRLFSPLLTRVMPKVSSAGNAMLKTTLAFTMAGASEGANVLPQEAWVVANMRYSHHQGGKSSIRGVKKLAKKFDIETVVLDPGNESPLSSYNSEAFKKVEGAVKEVFPAATTTPYIMVAASDCRYMHTLSKNCLRFTPLIIDGEQLESIHGIDENVDLATLAPAVDFYRRIIKEV